MWRVLIRRPLRLLLLVYLGIRCFSCIPQDQFECEDAAERLKRCCGWATVWRCTYTNRTDVSGGGCSGQPLVFTHTYEEPELLGRDAECLIRATCEDLRAAGACVATSWLLPDQCVTTNEGSSDGPPATQGPYNQDCKSPPQEGPCDVARPMDACKALRGLKCR